MNNPHAQIAFRVAFGLAAVGLGGALVAVIVGVALTALAPSGTAVAKVCGKASVVPAGGKDYLAQNNVWGADTAQCVTVGDQSLRVETAEHNRPPNGPPAASPSLVRGCHWKDCTDVGDLPVQVSTMPEITSDWASTQVDEGIFNAAYVVWFHSGPVAESTPDSAEMVIWMRSRGGVRPGGSIVAENVPISDARWNVWVADDGGRVRITYERVGEVTAVKGLDIRAFTMDSVTRGHIVPEWYLVGVEVGFNLWRGGAGNAVENFSVSVDESSPPPTSGTVAPAACSATLAVEEAWPGGFRADVVVTNSGRTAVPKWAVDWTFAGGQRVQGFWNAEVTQTGQAVRATSPARGTGLAPGATVTFGITAGGSPPNDLKLTCTSG